MRNAMSYIFYLIVILLLVVYWEGAKENVKAFGGALQNIIMTLQGRDPNSGDFEDYPS